MRLDGMAAVSSRKIGILDNLMCHNVLLNIPLETQPFSHARLSGEALHASDRRPQTRTLDIMTQDIVAAATHATWRCDKAFVLRCRPTVAICA